MIDINTYKKELIKEEVKIFANKMNVHDFHSMIQVPFIQLL